MSRAADRLKVMVNHLDRPSFVVSFSTSNKRLSHCHSLAVSRYFFDNDLLSTEQRISYEEDGFLLIKGLVYGEHIDRFRAAFEQIFHWEVQVPGLVVMRDVSIAKSEFIPDQKAISKLQDFQEEPELFRYCSMPQILNSNQMFRWSNIMAMHTMLINKPPDIGNKASRHSMHQDLHYFPVCPADRIVFSWTTMEKVHRQNVSLMVLPGSHHGTLKEHDYPEWEGGINKMYHGVRDYDPNHPRVHLDMEKGDSGFRKAISCHYARANCYYIDVRGTTQENIGQEVCEITARKYAVDDVDTWAVRGRLVQGDRTDL
uniref:phytanoyl-CoA dioxygenase n=1 Tax=Salmo trutta TaxID=8032 RepID=A0A673Y890_SALTR